MRTGNWTSTRAWGLAISVALHISGTLAPSVEAAELPQTATPTAAANVHAASPIGVDDHTARDVTFRALLGRWVQIEQQGGQVLAGRLLAFDAAWVTLSLAEDDEVVSLPRTQLAHVREWAPARSPDGQRAPKADDTVDAVPRRFGIHFGVLPSLMIDVTERWYYLFGNLNFLVPALRSRRSGFAITGTVGGGITYRVSPSSRWHFDLLGQLVSFQALSDDDPSVGVGLAIGFHHTSASGFSVAFKLPVVGYSGCLNSECVGSSGLAQYYQDAWAGTPVISLGHRF